MNNTLRRVGSLMVLGFILLMARPTKAASLQLVPNWGASGVPTNLSMYVYVPDNVVSNPPVLVLLHYWGGTASSVFAQAAGGGIVAAADQYGFIMVVPQRSSDCWDYGSAQALTRDGGGETHGIAQMVRFATTNYHANANRVYVTGDSCGGMMTEAMLAVYPDMFKAGAAYAGVPVGGAWTPVTHTAQEWGNLVRAAYPGYTGPRPRVQLWHGTADGLVNYSNLVEATMQWGNVLGLNPTPTTTTTVTIPDVTNQWTHQIWRDTNGSMLLDAWSDIGGDHGPSDALFKARYVIPFLGLDQVGPVDPKASGQRARPHLNAARTTFVADNNQPLRGPYTSTEWTSATDYTNIAKMKALGFNAVHLYGESFDKTYPTNGSTAPGYALSRIDSIVQSTRDLGLYLVITIGNGAWNGDYNRAYITNFWNLYGARYANETHVLYEIQNEPVAWGPPYSSAGATPPGALDMEVAAYRAIRANAPDTPVLLFTYAVLGGTGGADAALTDIHAFNQTVFGTQNAIWTNMAVGFHGYAGVGSFEIAVSNILRAGYPCLQTEFCTGTWGGGLGGLDYEGVAALERLGVSWLAFTYIPPTGVSDDVTRPDAYVNRVLNSGLSWTPDYGTFPVSGRSAYGNGGYPWTTPGFANNALSGTLRIEAENFDNGGKHVAYYNANSSNPGGQYRTGETVGIETTSDTGGGYNVGWIAAGDWLEFTIKVPVAGTYDLRLRVAGTGVGSVRALAYGNNRNQTTSGVDLTGEWTLPNTGGWQTWQTVTKSVFLGPDQQRLRINVLAAGFNLNWIELSPAGTGTIADGTYKLLNAANAAAMELSTSNTVITATPSGANNQQWSFRHIGGGLYQVTPAAGGNSWDSGGSLHISPWYWGAGGNSCFIMLPANGGFYRLFSTGSGSPLQPSTDNPPAVNDGKIYTGAAAQQWAIVSPSALLFPAGLSVTAASSTQVSLSWGAVSGASSYNVKRSSTKGGPYTTIATGVTSANYSETVIAGMKYYYVVSAVSGSGESLDSLEATVNLPYPWMTQDIGSVGLAGGASFSNGVFTLNGSGDDIWNTADAFRYAHMSVTGDFTIVARVAGLQNVDGWSKAGLMVRESLAANSMNAFIAVTPGNGVTFQSRSSTGGNTGNIATTGLAAPYWVRLVRSGNTFTGFRSPDGVNWTQQGTATIALSSTAFVGLALTSHNNSSLCAAMFDNVNVPGWPNWTTPPAPSGLVAVAGNGQATLTWNAASGATSYNVKRATVNGGPYTTVANVTTTSYANTGLSNGTTYYYVVSALNPAGEGDNCTPASATPQVPAPAAPTGLAATAGDAQVALTWSAASGATSYNVKQATVNGGPYTTVANVTTTSYVNTGLVNGTTYYYVVSALNAGGESANSTQSSATPQVPAPAAPTGLAATAGDAQAALTWSAASGATSYNVKQATVNGGPYTTVANVTTTSYVNTGLVNGTTYYYVVSALNAGGESANSMQSIATPQVPAPAAPTGLAATAGDAQAALTWSAASGATSYNVKQATVNGGPYTTVANVTTTSYVNTGLVNGTTYYYVVSALNAGGESANSAQISATPVADLPSPWMTQDVGTVGVVGGTSYSNNVFTVTGSGDDIWNTADAFRFVFVTNSGDCTIIARVSSVQNINPWSKAGVMIRESLAADAANALLAVTPANGVSFQFRASTGGDSSFSNTTNLNAPCWVKLVRSGNVFTGYRSADGVNWTQQGTATITMGSGVYVGLAVSSHDNAALCTATFDGVITLKGNLAGAVVGSAGSWNSSGNTITNVFDGNINTFYDAVNGTGDWAGLDFGSGLGGVVSTIKYCPRPGFASRMVGGQFQAANAADFSSGVVTLFTVASAPTEGVMTAQTVTNTTAYRYLRYISPTNGFCNVAEVEFWGAYGIPTAIPVVPTGLVATAGNAQVTLAWNASSGATSYNVKRATTSGGPYTTVTNVTTTSCVNAGLANGTTYYYVVSALNAGGESGNSTQASATPQVPAPSVPTGLAATAGNAQVTLAWSAASGATSYNVKRATTSGGPYTTVTNVTTTSFVNAGLVNGTTYYYVVSALNAGGESGNSTQASATPQVPAPSTPTGLAATPGIAQVSLSWNASSGATSYNVKRATTSGGAYTTIASPTTTSYTDTGLTGGTTYYYVVSALNAGGQSANSTQVSALVPANGITNGTYKLIARHSGKAMDAYGAQTTNGTQIIQWTYGGGANQKWTITGLASNLCQIIGVQSGKALEIASSTTTNGSKVQLRDYVGGSNQKFTLTATDSGYYRITPAHATGSCLDVSGISTADGALVHLWQWLSGTNQQWAPQAP
jgi:poly(hydroxyalkanoate) depolymerase family esterase